MNCTANQIYVSIKFLIIIIAKLLKLYKLKEFAIMDRKNKNRLFLPVYFF